MAKAIIKRITVGEGRIVAISNQPSKGSLMSPAIFLIIAGLQGVMSVTLGAYSAHGMAPEFAAQAIAWVETGTQYQMTHACALTATASALCLFSNASCRLGLKVAGVLFAVGAFLFPGALYGLAFFGGSMFATVAPIGGGALILGWIAVAAAGTAAAVRSGSADVVDRSAAGAGDADDAQ